MRVSTAFNRMLAIPGAWVTGVTFSPDGVIVDLRLRARRLRCPCGVSVTGRYDARMRSWRHLDLGACRLFLRYDIRRLWCPSCARVRSEEVPWARPRARHTRDFEDVACWLAQRADKTTVSRLLRCSWEGVDAIVGRVVTEMIDTHRLDDLYRIGVDEISYRRGSRYVTIVADHDSGHVVWAGEGRGRRTIDAFYEELGPERTAQLEAVSMDMAPTYRSATERAAPQAWICFDPFHVIRYANGALDSVYAATASELGLTGAEWRSTRFTLRRAAEGLTRPQRGTINRLRRARHVLWRAWELKEELRDLYRVNQRNPRRYLKTWIERARRSRIRPFVLLAKRLEEHAEGVAASVAWGLSNSRLEGINQKVRLIIRRGYGYHSPAALIAMTYLTCGGLTVELPMKR